MLLSFPVLLSYFQVTELILRHAEQTLELLVREVILLPFAVHILRQRRPLPITVPFRAYLQYFIRIYGQFITRQCGQSLLLSSVLFFIELYDF